MTRVASRYVPMSSPRPRGEPLRIWLRTRRMYAPLVAKVAASVLVLVSLAAVSIGCSSHFDGHVYRGNKMVFEVSSVPPSWRRIDANEVLLAFRDDQHHVTIMVNGRCGKDGDDVPLEALTKHLFLYFTERQVLQQQRWMLDEREALRTVEMAKLDGVPRRFVSVVLKKNDCVYDFIHVGGPVPAPSSERAFDRFVRGFHTLTR